MGYEIDVLGVGKESKSGDAIALRWGNLRGNRNEQRVVLIDGGFRETGEDVVNHIKRYYGTTSIDAVVSTHPDQDHVNGLHIILDELDVKELWIHRPWEHNRGLAEKFLDGRVTDESIGRRLKESLDSAADLVAKAESKNIHMVEPFSGISLHDQGEFRVLVVQHYCIDGYSDFSLMRASSVVKRQSTRTVSWLRRFCQASTSHCRTSRSGIRRARHCRAITPISISAMFSQLPCLGV